MRQIMQECKSYRNEVPLAETGSVEKKHQSYTLFSKELAIHRSLQEAGIPSANVVETETDFLLRSHQSGQNYLALLEQQEWSGKIDYRPWTQLVIWLMMFRQATGQILTNLNLQDFIYDSHQNVAVGLAYKECAVGHEANMVALLAACIRTCEPKYSEIKRRVSNYIIGTFAEQVGFTPEALFELSVQKEILLLERGHGMQTARLHS